MVHLKKINSLYIKVETKNKNLLKALDKKFCYLEENYWFSPKYKAKLWDGKRKVFNLKSQTIPIGLSHYIEAMFDSKGIKYTKDYEIGCITKKDDAIETSFFVDGEETEAYYYQKGVLKEMVNTEKSICLSPTASGKSGILYLWVLNKIIREEVSKVLICVPFASLVNQLKSQFIEYSDGAFKGQISTSKEPKDEFLIHITTWQACYKKSPLWFSQFNGLACDELHKFDSKCTRKISQKSINCEHRLGLTARLKGSKVHKLEMMGHFGKIHKTKTTQELIDEGFLSPFSIETKALIHNRKLTKVNYSSEVSYLVNLEIRNNYICDLTSSLEGNSLIFFRFIDQGKYLRKFLEDNYKDKKIYYIDQKVSIKERDEIKAIANTAEKDVILVCSYGTSSTGLDIKNINNIVFAHPTKSIITIMQAIGRGLRKATNGLPTTLYDIADDVYSGTTKCYSYKHYIERLELYRDENFKINYADVNLYEENNTALSNI